MTLPCGFRLLRSIQDSTLHLAVFLAFSKDRVAFEFGLRVVKEFPHATF